MRLCFVSAIGGSAFMHELLEVVAASAEEAGASISIHTGAFPDPDEPCAYVVVPHEYFVLTPEHEHPTPHQLSRTVGLCVEHPGNATFETTVRFASKLGGAVDINRDSTQELRRRGIPAERFVLGYSPRWDRWHGSADKTRPIDIAYLGTTDVRRDRLLVHQAEALSGWRTTLLIPPHEQMTKPRPDFLMGDDKFELLTESKILLNLHRGGSHALEWVRVLEAMCNGCVVVSEHSTDFEPLVPGTHIAFARGEVSVDVAAALLHHPDRLQQIREDAYSFCRDSLSMAESAARFCAIADELVTSPDGKRSSRPQISAQTELANIVPEPAPPEAFMPTLQAWAAELPGVVRKGVVELISNFDDSHAIEIRETPSTSRDTAHPRIDAIIASGVGDMTALGETERSLAAQDTPIRILSAWSTTGGTELAIPRGRLRNRMLKEARADYVLIVDPGQRLFPKSARVLQEALDTQDAAVAHGMLADTNTGLLWNALPAEAERLRQRVYLGTPLLIRRDVLTALGGYSEDATLLGYEDHELWLRLVDREYTAVMVPEIVARGPAIVRHPLAVHSVAPELTVAALVSNPNS